MATSGQNYAVGIGTGAAGGAAIGSSILPGWGTAIGAGVGAIGGAISGAFANSEEAKQRAKLDSIQKRRKKSALLMLLRNQAASAGIPTAGLDAQMDMQDENWREGEENAQFAAQHRISPNAFVGMAQNGLAAAGRTYNGFNQQPQSSPTYPSDFQLTQPSLLDEGGGGGGAGSVLPTDDYQLRPYNPARFLRQDI